MKGINVKSEIKPLKKVLLHRPGKELLNITPKNLNELLFDDIPYLDIAQKEHDAFADILRSNGVEVVYLEKLVGEVLDLNPDLKVPFLKQFIFEGGVDGKYYRELLLDYFLNNFTNQELVNKLIEGVRLNEFPKEKAITLHDLISDYDTELVLDPLPNLYFQRDPMSSIGNGVTINRMRFNTRRRETIFADLLFKHHPDFKDVKKFYERNEIDTIEGGDITNLNERCLAIGLSERTSADGVEKVALNCFKDEECEIREVYAFLIPSTRAFMHLDTVFTQVDYDKFAVHPLIQKPLRVFKLTPDGRGGLHIKEKDGTLDKILADILKLDSVELLPCGGNDRIASSREQWNDGSNTLCIAPGKIITYQRNDITNDYYRQRGLDVLEMPSCELSRGRGGPRCMSMPLIRED